MLPKLWAARGSSQGDGLRGNGDRNLAGSTRAFGYLRISIRTGRTRFHRHRPNCHGALRHRNHCSTPLDLFCQRFRLTPGELFTALGYVTGVLVLIWAARQKSLVTDGMAQVALAGLVGGVIGAKLTELIFEGWPIRIGLAAALDPRTGGRALLGGIVFGWVGVELAKRKLGIRRSTGDLFALALPAGEAVGRIGCFFNECCFGTKCSAPWAVYQHGEWRHPVQLYSALTAGLVFTILLASRRKFTREGDLFRLFLILFGTTRFALEFLRQNDTFWLGFTPMQ